MAKFKPGDIIKFYSLRLNKYFILSIVSCKSDGLYTQHYTYFPIVGKHTDLNGGDKSDFTFTSGSEIGLEAKVIPNGKLLKYLYDCSLE